MLTLLKARKITNQAVVRAGKLNVNVSVAVCDTTGSAYPVEPDGRIGGLGDGPVLYGKSGPLRLLPDARVTGSSTSLKKAERDCLHAAMWFPSGPTWWFSGR